MSAKSSSRSHALAWLLAIVAVPVLYVLSVGPICAIDAHGKLPAWASEGVDAYHRPYLWLAQRLHLQSEFDRYLGWWHRKLDK